VVSRDLFGAVDERRSKSRFLALFPSGCNVNELTRFRLRAVSAGASAKREFEQANSKPSGLINPPLQLLYGGFKVSRDFLGMGVGGEGDG
jgi:hypothetical protein